jgi:hypothetical protein
MTHQQQQQEALPLLQVKQVCQLHLQQALMVLHWESGNSI